MNRISMIHPKYLALWGNKNTGPAMSIIIAIVMKYQKGPEDFVISSSHDLPVTQTAFPFLVTESSFSFGNCFSPI